MSSSLELSKRLRELSDEQLAQLAATRLASSGAIKDYFDLADALLTHDSIMRALQRLPLEQLLILRTCAQGMSALTDKDSASLSAALLGPADGSGLYPEVSSVLLEVTEELTAAPETTAIPAETDSTLRDAAALERSLSIITSVDELARFIQSHPVKELARGGFSAQDTQRLTPLMPSPDVSPDAVVTLASLTGILARHGSWWLPTEKLENWLRLPIDERWIAVVRSWEESLSPELRLVLKSSPHWGKELRASLDVHFPLGHDWLTTELESSTAAAELLGLTASNEVTSTGRAVLAGDWERVSSAITAVVPPFAEHVFVQHDFSVVAPGPLKPEDDVFMRALCAVESRGLATTFRITAQGTNHLLAQGATAQEILDHLTALAATPIPQAVSYFITDLGERFGSVRVREVSGNTQVTATDPLVLRTIASDHSLRSVGLRPVSENVLHCSLAVGIVLNALLDSKYPAQLEDAAGNIIAAPVQRPAVEIVPEVANPHVALVQRLRGSREAATTDDATWIARQIDLALREKNILIVTVNMPDGEREFTIEPKGFSNGRLRCLDRKTDVERTLPASHITAVRLA